MLSPGHQPPAPPPSGTSRRSFAADQPDLHERAENYELQLPYQ